MLYEILVEPVPAELQLDHLCRVTSCVNPMHLESVTRSENLKRGIGIGGRRANQGKHPRCATCGQFVVEMCRCR